MSADISSALLLALADAAIKSAALLVLAAALSASWRKASAAARHALWCGALVGALLMPVLSYALPAWHVPWLPQWMSLEPVTPTATAQPSTSHAQLVEQSDVFAPPQPTTLSNPDLSAFSAPSPVAAKPETSHSNLEKFFLGWLLGALVALLPLLAGWWQAARLTRRGRHLEDAAWTSLRDAVAQSLGLRRNVRLLATPGAVMPFTWGAWRPVVIFPAAAHDWAPARRRLVLLHEFGHIRRLDWLTQTLGSLVCVLYWFNPLAWLAARQLRLEREQACDDLVLRSGPAARDYAGELLEIAAQSARSRMLNWVAVPVARHSKLEIRLRAILDGTRNRRSLTRAALLALVALVSAMVIPIAMLQAAPAAADKPTTPSTSTTKPGMATLTFALRFTKAQDIAVLGNSIAAGMNESGPNPPGGLTHSPSLPNTVFKADENTNSVIVTTERSLETKVWNLLIQADAPLATPPAPARPAASTLQIQIEARVLIAPADFKISPTKLTWLDGYRIGLVIDALDQRNGFQLLCSPKMIITDGDDSIITAGDADAAKKDRANSTTKSTPANASPKGLTGMSIQIKPQEQADGVHYALKTTLNFVDTQAPGTTAQRLEWSDHGVINDGGILVAPLGALSDGKQVVGFFTFNEITSSQPPTNPLLAVAPGTIFSNPTIVNQNTATASSTPASKYSAPEASLTDPGQNALFEIFKKYLPEWNNPAPFIAPKPSTSTTTPGKVDEINVSNSTKSSSNYYGKILNVGEIVPTAPSTGSNPTSTSQPNATALPPQSSTPGKTQPQAKAAARQRVEVELWAVTAPKDTRPNFTLAPTQDANGTAIAIDHAPVEAHLNFVEDNDDAGGWGIFAPDAPFHPPPGTPPQKDKPLPGSAKSVKVLVHPKITEQGTIQYSLDFDLAFPDLAKPVHYSTNDEIKDGGHDLAQIGTLADGRKVYLFYTMNVTTQGTPGFLIH